MSSNRKLHNSALTFFDYSPRTEESVVQSQVGEVLVVLVACVQPPEDRRDGSVAEPECGCGKNIGGGGVHSWIVSSVGSNVMLEQLWANNFWNVISDGYNLGAKN